MQVRRRFQFASMGRTAIPRFAYRFEGVFRQMRPNGGRRQSVRLQRPPSRDKFA